MDEVKKPVENGVSSVDLKNEAEVIFGGITYKISRLKAGRFYDALKVYMDMIKDVAPNTPSQGQGEEPVVNFDNLVVSMFQTWPEKMVKFISVCCDKATLKSNTAGEDGVDPISLSEQKINEDSYPEEITEAFRTCLKLNRVGENLKNFVAPIGEIGAQTQVKPQG